MVGYMIQQEQRLYSSGELLRAVGCTRKALRVYQAKGLIQPEKASGNRRYGADAFDRLRLIVELRELGLSVDKIRDVLGVQEGQSGLAGPVARMLADEVADLVPRVTEKMEALARIRHRLIVARETLLACAGCDNAIEVCQQCADNGTLDAASRVLLAGR